MIDEQNRPAPKIPRRGWVWFGLVFLVLLAGALGFFTMEQAKKDSLGEARQKVPEKLLLSAGNRVLYKPGSAEATILRKGEVASEGIQYTVDVPIGEALKKLLGEMVQNGWAVVGNFKEQRGSVSMRVSAGDKMIYIQLSSLDPNQTKVSITPIVKQ